MTLDATIKGASANSYATVAEAETYFDTRLHADTWDALESGSIDKEKSLQQAARILDSYVMWLGWKSDEDQAMAWPRWGICHDGREYFECVDWALRVDGIYSVDADTIPQAIKDAQCELALYLLGTDSQAAADTAGFKRISVAGAVALEVDKIDRTMQIPGFVWHIVSHLGIKKGGASVQLLRG